MFKRVGTGIGWTLALGFQFVGIILMPVAAYLLWDDHRGLAYLALVSIFVGLTPFIALPLAIGFIAYATSESTSWTIVTVLLAIVVGVGLPMLMFSRLDEEEGQS